MMQTPVSGYVQTQRLYSLDALRGFDMLWIMGLGAVATDFSATRHTPFWNAIGVQLEHKVWNGFVFWDLIFPLFMFMVGVATPFSVGRSFERGSSKGRLVYKIVRRGVILILIGIVYNNGLQLREVSDIRFPSVLGKIGATYVFANLIYLYAGKKMQWLWFWGLLIGYWLLLKFGSAPGYPAGDLTEPGNLMSYLDRSILPGRLSRGIHDTVGLICTVTGICNVLLGIFAGDILKHNKFSAVTKLGWLVYGGAASVLLGMLWSLDFPFNKNLWSSSFVLLTGGISLLLLSVFYYIIDVLGYRRWCFFFRVIGMNSILIYISPVFIDWGYTANALFKWMGQLFGEPYQKVVMGCGMLLVQWAFLYFLYKKRVFLKV